MHTHLAPPTWPAHTEDSAESADSARCARVAALADEIARTISIARVLAQQGRTIDLAGLDERVGLLCAQTLDLGPQAAAPMRARLHALRAELDALADNLGTAIPAAPAP